VAFARCDSSLDTRARWEIPNDKPLLLTVGRLSRQKNHALLLRALRDIPEAHLAIVGDGELRDDLAALAAALRVDDRVHFTREIAPDAVAGLLQECNVFVFPSLWEGLPMAAIEALQAGAPIVASDIPANREVLADAAVVVPADDASALADAVRLVLEDPVLANSLRGRAKQRAACFTASSMIDRYLQLICGEAPASMISRSTDRGPAALGLSKEHLS
jgi:glycosyltransferase involved in cell wall biosynthesis